MSPETPKECPKRRGGQTLTQRLFETGGEFLLFHLPRSVCTKAKFCLAIEAYLNFTFKITSDHHFHPPLLINFQCIFYVREQAVAGGSRQEDIPGFSLH